MGETKFDVNETRADVNVDHVSRYYRLSLISPELVN